MLLAQTVQVIGNQWTPFNTLLVIAAVLNAVLTVITAIQHKGTSTKVDANAESIKTIESDVYTTKPADPFVTQPKTSSQPRIQT